MQLIDLLTVRATTTKNRIKFLAGAFLCAALVACGTAPERIAATTSSYPEIEIKTVDKDAIRSNLIRRNLDTGWSLEQETPSMLLFTKVDSSGSVGSAVTQALIGNRYSTPPKYELKYTLASYKDFTKVITHLSVSTQMAMGQINRMELNGNTDFNNLQMQLNRVKGEIESIASK